MARRLTWAALLGAVLAGCYVAYDPYYWDYPYWDPYYYGYEGYLVSEWSESADASAAGALVDLESTAAALAADTARFTPAGCATASSSGTTLTYAFSGCEGPFEVGAFSGSATLRLSESNGALVLTATSDDLVLDGRPFVLDLRATTTRTGTRHVAAVESRSHAPDEVDAREASGTVSWEAESGCLELTGHGGSTRGSLDLTSTLTAYERCARACPIGGEVAVRGAEGLFSARFDGSPALIVVGPNGEQETHELRCR